MNNKKPDFKKNVFTLRISNDDSLKFLNELFETGLYSSINELLNKALDIGVLELAKQHLRHKPLRSASSVLAGGSVPENTKEIQRVIKQIELNTDDLFVIINILEHMLATIFNAKTLELYGEPVSAEDMLSGRLSDLPDDLQAVKDEIIKRHSRS